MFRVGIIGTGKPWKTEGATGFGMSHRHVGGYKRSADCELTAVCDIVEENAKAFAEQHGAQRFYTDYPTMLEKENLDIVSVCTWPHLHAPMVLACAEAGVKAIHCEKPIATTYGDARRMVETCEAKGVQLTFNHQRRFNVPFRKARDLRRDGAIGTLERMELICGNLYDWGTHWFDMTFMLNDETPAEWVIGQIDLRGHHQVFGAPIEGQGLAHWKCANGVQGTMYTGHDNPKTAQVRLVGTDGIIEVAPPDGPQLRVLKYGGNWEAVDTDGDTIHGDDANAQGVVDLVEALKAGREPELAGRRALRATELIFGTYESSRRRGRVDFPLEIEDSPLQAMLDAQAGAPAG